MATTTVTGTIKDHREQPIANGLVTFAPDAATFDASASYVAQLVQATTNGSGVVSVELHPNQRYNVVEPFGARYAIVVPQGVGSVSLQALRAEEAMAPTAINSVQVAVDASIALKRLIDLAAGATAWDAGKYLRSTANGWEWATVAAGAGSLVGLSDGPQAYGSGGALLASTGTGWTWFVPEYADATAFSNHVAATNPHGLTAADIGAALLSGATFVGQVKLPSGTAAAPGLAFSADAGMGFYLITQGVNVGAIGLALDGDIGMRFAYNTANGDFGSLVLGNNNFIGARSDGLMVRGSNTDLDLRGDYASLYTRRGESNSVGTHLYFRHDTNSTPADGFGARHVYQLRSSTSSNQTAAALEIAWTEVTHALRTARWGVKLAYNASDPHADSSHPYAIVAERTGVAGSTALWLFSEDGSVLKQVFEETAVGGKRALYTLA